VERERAESGEAEAESGEGGAEAEARRAEGAGKQEPGGRGRHGRTAGAARGRRAFFWGVVGVFLESLELGVIKDQRQKQTQQEQVEERANKRRSAKWLRGLGLGLGVEVAILSAGLAGPALLQAG
jgi:hypothetical protein